MKFSKILTVCLMLGFGQLTATFAESKLVSGDPNMDDRFANMDDRFGWSVDISGHTIIVGAPNNHENDVIEHGSAYIFALKREGNKDNWEQQAVLDPQEDGRLNDNFGYSVGIDGDYAAAGSPGINSSTGAVYTYKRTGGVWKQQQKLIPADAKKRDNFGYSVDMLGEHLIIGAYLDDSKAGSVYIFNRNGDRWRQQAKLTGNDTAKGDNFGVAVALGGNENGVDFAIVGSPNNTHNGKKSGAAYIFVHDGGKWTEEAKLVPADAQTSDFIGDAVSISGYRGIKRYALVGAPHLDLAQDVEGRNSAAYIFSSDGGAWTEEAKLKAKDPEKADGFGSGVSINRNIALVGVPRHGEGAILDGELNAGIVYPYLREGDGWTRQQARATTVAPDFPEQSFGNVVIATQEFIVIAAYGLGKGNPGRGDPMGGAVYVYHTQRDWKLPYAVEPSVLRAATLGGIKRTALFQNFPNPFNPETWLPYQLGRKSNVTLRIYNTRGHLVRRLDVGLQPAGSYRNKDAAAYWDGQDQFGQSVSSGLYFYTLSAGTSQITRRMLILK